MPKFDPLLYMTLTLWNLLAAGSNSFIKREKLPPFYANIMLYRNEISDRIWFLINLSYSTVIALFCTAGSAVFPLVTTPHLSLYVLKPVTMGLSFLDESKREISLPSQDVSRYNIDCIHWKCSCFSSTWKYRILNRLNYDV